MFIISDTGIQVFDILRIFSRNMLLLRLKIGILIIVFSTQKYLGLKLLLFP